MKISTTVTLFILIQNVIGSSSGQPSTTSTPPTTPTTTITTTSTTATSTTTTTPEPTTPIDYCKNTSTCLNSGVCLNGTNKFVCECIDDFTGANCETKINECDSSPCENNATCNDQVNGYNCTCPPVYNGTHCKTEINECDNFPCENNATCNDQVNGYNCTCLPGYNGTHCKTDILPPKSIQLEDISTTGFTIHIDQASFLLFNIKLNDTKKTNINTNDTDYKIDELTPGTCYSIEVSMVVRDQFSKPVIKNICLPPAHPKVITRGSQTTDSITIGIVHGDGKIDHFDIFINGIYKSSTTPYQKGADATTTVIHDLVPGTLYDQISVVTVTNGLNSTLEMMMSWPTYPDPPANIEVMEQTDKCISLNITKGFGRTESFHVYVNDKQKFTDCKVSNDEYTICKLSNLLPGRIYQIKVAAFSNDLESVNNSISAVTKPNVPQININNTSTTTKEIYGTISQTDGGSDKYDLFCKEKLNLNFSINHSNFIINDLEPGHLYHIQATATFHNHTSDRSKLIIVCTVPHKPEVTVNKTLTSTSMIHGTILQTIGGNDNFTLYVDDVKYSNYTITNSSYLIRGLNPGQNYKIQATTTFCSFESVMSDPVEECTVPNAPEIVRNVSTATTTTLSGCILQENSNRYTFKLYYNETKELQYKIRGSDYEICSLQPGHRYYLQATTSFCNHTSGQSKQIEQCTVPYQPMFQIDSNSTTTKSISGIIRQTKGGNDNFTLYCEGQTNLNYTIKDNKYSINDLEPGQHYRCQATSTFCQHTSARTSLIDECTVPYPPNFEIDNKTTTTTSISGTIHQIKGGSDNFTLYCDGQTMLNYTVDGYKYSINNLEPGQRYSCQATSVFCKHTSAKTSLIEECTVPSTPKFTINRSSTTNQTISGSISQPDGGHDNFILDCDSVDQLIYSVNGSKYTIQNLIPGKLYQCQAWSTFCNRTSAIATSLKESTVPTKPTFDVNKSTNETTDLIIIIKGNGVVEGYNVTMTPVDVDQCSTKQPTETMMLSYSTNRPQYTVNIDSLNPGTLYNISVISVSNGRHSLPHYLQHATYASPPLSVTTDIDKDSITFSITKGTGCVKYFIISIDEKKYNVTALKGKEMTQYTVNNLDPSTTYKVTISVVSKGAETSRQISFKTKNDPVPVIGGVIGAVLALLVIGIFVVSWRRQAMCFRKNQSTEVLDGKTNIGFEEEVEMADSRKKRPVKLTDFPRHVEYLSRNTNMGFAAEFKEFGVLSPKHSTNAAQLQENRPKNRYTNILPFDSSIVKLVGADDEPGSDFINANFIPGKRSPREYIAAQGPLPATKEDMWSMIWEQNASIVVMLTQIVERGRKKCEIYWPENLNEKMLLGDIIVEVETLSHLPDYVLRTIVLRLGDVEKRLRHYNYIAWPDMGTPATTDNMISFVDTVRKDIRPDMKGPIVVHCSAGVGRTGTFIVMDIFLQEIRSQCKEVDIFGTILNLRNNRVNMVQTEDQYIFIHNCVRDFIEASDDEEEEVVDDEQCNEPIYQNV